ncbi:RnfABCDGE type electron transport complex subunit D [Paracoccus sp. (in: a-proteobacteria)]|uniref:RnfABCDGE type electron transport complex subunit D n=1 Tax=Paracoccus sp. TaxID=267 RepID=UPI0026DF2D1A|nr:RnfABCDGE type electron transport complex subunit D [Paracoccus sp. (in: a-proteobacteria)]MDO5647089.1 RnfABCDGE type electron transport complex subunit D [Paracoccus sp. (in: a-proteobacteria)]
MQGIWSRETNALLLIATALPMAAMWLSYGGADAVGRLIFVLIVAGLWHVVFMLARAQPPSFAGALTALYIAMLAPVGLGPVALILSVSFGVVMAELVFGGWGRNILNPATVTLAFVGFGFPAAPWPELAVPVGWAVWPAAAIGLWFGVINWRLIAGAGVAWAVLAALGVTAPVAVTAAAGVVLVGLVADPVASAATQLGRWLNGAVYALLVGLFATQWADAAPVQLAVSAALLASLAAPLFDEIALAIWHARRRKRLG